MTTGANNQTLNIKDAKWPQHLPRFFQGRSHTIFYEEGGYYYHRHTYTELNGRFYPCSCGNSDYFIYK